MIQAGTTIFMVVGMAAIVIVFHAMLHETANDLDDSSVDLEQGEDPSLTHWLRFIGSAVLQGTNLHVCLSQ